MPLGLSVHAGLDELDAGHYGTALPINGAENDATSMAAVATGRGFEARTLLTSGATVDAVLAALREAVERIGSDGIVMFTFAGHGGLIPQLGADPAKPWTEPTFALFDRMLLREELRTVWSQARPGARILVIADCCHSGTPAMLFAALTVGTAGAALLAQQNAQSNERKLPDDVLVDVFNKHRELYQALQRALPVARVGERNLIGIGACQPDELALSDPNHGAFTTELLRALDDGFSGTYRMLVDVVGAALLKRPVKNPPPPFQHPAYDPEGDAATSAFATEPAFTI